MSEARRTAQVEGAASGDLDALQRLIVYYHRPLRRLIEPMIGHSAGKRLDPDDVLQEAYVAAFKSVAGCSFNGPAGFYKWLERIALNQLKDQQRALGRQKRDVGCEVGRQQAARTSLPDLLGRLVSPDSTPSRQAAKAEVAAAAVSSLARLIDDQRRVVQMRFLEGRAVPEIATILGKTEPAVHMLCHRGLKELRRLMVSITRYLTRL